MAHMVLRGIVNEIKAATYFAIIADGATDIEGKEEFFVCLRKVHPDTFKKAEIYLGMYKDAKGELLAAAIKDVLLRF